MLPSPNKASSGFVFPFLDGLRGVAVLSVVVHHCFYFNSSSRFGLGMNSLLNAGRLGVAIFFVMSGFLMGLAVFGKGEQFDWRPYSIRRIGKILAPFLLSLAFATLLWLPFHGPSGVGSSILSNLTALVSFRVPLPSEMNVVYWSLFVEAHFYACLPLVYLGLRKIVASPDVWTCLLFFLVPVGVRVVLFCACGPSYRHGIGCFRTDFPLRLDAFAPGLLFAIIYLRRRGFPAGRLVRVLPWAGALLLSAAYLFLASTHYFTDLKSLDYGGAFAEIGYILAELGTFLVLFLCFNQSALLARALSMSWIAFIGIVSYELYLLHYPIKLLVLNFIPHSEGSVWKYFLLTAAPTVVSVGLSAVVFFLFSNPVLKRAKIWANTFRKASPAKPLALDARLVPLDGERLGARAGTGEPTPRP